MRTLRASLVCLVVAVACGRDEDAAPPAPPPSESGAVALDTEATHEHMQAQFDAIVAIRDALIDGDMEVARQHAKAIVDESSPPPAEPWQQYFGEIRGWATDLTNASEIGQAAAAGSELARACGRCHAAQGVIPELELPAAPPVDEPGRVPHMQRHHSAADRMWEGLIGPSEERWLAGIDELVDTPLLSDEIVEGQDVEPMLTDLANQVHELGTEARGIPATAWDTRVAYYARFLATCASCHDAARR